MQEIEWVTVTETNGLMVAELLAERLKAAKIPAFAVQESVGKAYGFSIGPLSVAYVRVPIDYLEEARLLLDIDEPVDSANIVICPGCESEIILDDDEWEQGWFSCPVCGRRVSLDALF